MNASVKLDQNYSYTIYCMLRISIHYTIFWKFRISFYFFYFTKMVIA